jgi:Na+/H+-dicarboxylate symporter
MNQFELEKGEFKTVSDEILLDNENHRPKAFYEDPSLQVIVAAVLAIGLGVAIQFSTESVPSIATILVAVPGKLWLNALKALVVPLIFVSMVQAIQSMRSLNKSGAVKMVKATIVYYISTTVFAILEGIILVCIFPKPGVASADDLGKLGNAKDNLQSRSVEEQIEGLFLSFIPSNLVAAFLVSFH